MPAAGVVISPHAKGRVEPSYDDFMNSVFSNKPHRSYLLREKADRRSEVLKDKFMGGLNKNAADDQRINAEYEAKVKQTAAQLTARMDK